jgi:hypothetical protein
VFLLRCELLWGDEVDNTMYWIVDFDGWRPTPGGIGLIIRHGESDTAYFTQVAQTKASEVNIATREALSSVTQICGDGIFRDDG